MTHCHLPVTDLNQSYTTYYTSYRTVLIHHLRPFVYVAYDVLATLYNSALTSRAWRCKFATSTFSASNCDDTLPPTCHRPQPPCPARCTLFAMETSWQCCTSYVIIHLRLIYVFWTPYKTLLSAPMRGFWKPCMRLIDMDYVTYSANVARWTLQVCIQQARSLQCHRP